MHFLLKNTHLFLKIIGSKNFKNKTPELYLRPTILGKFLIFIRLYHQIHNSLNHRVFKLKKSIALNYTHFRGEMKAPGRAIAG